MSHLLVVDDAAVDRKLVGGLLENQTHYQVEYASNGLDALEQIEAKLPLAVITDLQMPDMDGMQLVAKMREIYPTVPAILITGFGSEDIALQALLQGAADYVPKSALATELAHSVESVLQISDRERPQQRLSHCLQYEELRYEIENDVRLVAPLVSKLQQSTIEMGIVDQHGSIRLGKAIAEAIRNAIYHGNLEISSSHLDHPDEAAAVRREEAPYSQRRVHVRANLAPDQARFVIRDEGNGFDLGQLPNVQLDPSRLTQANKRGLVLIHTFVDEVIFNESGNEVTLVKNSPAYA